MIAQANMSGEAPGRRSGGKRSRLRRRLALAVLVLSLTPLALSCFPGPVGELWPPRPGEPRHQIDVVLWDWHSRITERIPPTPAGVYREWEYSERGWYLEGKQGTSGVLRAMLWPSASALRQAELEIPAWERLKRNGAERWTFFISERGRRAMDAHLERQRGSPIPDHPDWYEGAKSYHLFHACHHFTAQALREAGLPIASWWAFTGGMLGIQLDRVARFHRQAGLWPEVEAPPAGVEGPKKSRGP